MRIMNSFVVRVAMLVLMATSVHACSDSGTGPSDPDLVSLGEVLSEAARPDVAAAGSVLLPFLSIAPPGSIAPSSCSHDAGSGTFVCSPISSNGFTIERSFILFDAAGNRQAQFARGTTAAVRTITHVAGSSAFGANSHTIVDQTDDRTVSGLLGSRHVLNGASAITLQRSSSSPYLPTPTIESNTSTTVIENLVLPSRDERWPGPGSMTTKTTSTFGTLPSWSSSARAVFDGTKCVTFTFNSGDSWTLRIDMSNGRGEPCAG